MTGFLEDMFLRMDGITDEQIAQLNAALPDLKRAVALVKPHLPLLTTIVQLVVAKEEELK